MKTVFTRLLVILSIVAMLASLVLVGSAAAPLTDGQTIRGDVNGDNAINMKDVLMLRMFIADLPVDFAPHECGNDTDGAPVRGDVNGDGTINMKDVLMMRMYIADLDVEFADHECGGDPTGTEATATGTEATATGTEATATGTEATVTGTEATATGTEATLPTMTAPVFPTESQVEPTQPTVAPTEPTQTPTQAPTQPVIDPTQPVVDPTQPVIDPTQPVIDPTQPTVAPTEPTQAPTQAPTQPVIDPTQPTVAPTQPTVAPTQPTIAPTQSQPAGDGYTLSLNVTEYIGNKYGETLRTDSWNVPKNQNSTMEIVVIAYQDLNTSDMDTIKGFVNLSGATLVDNPSVSEIIDHHYYITYTYTVMMDSDKTVSGTISSPVFKAFDIAVNGQGGTTPTTAPTEPAATHMTPNFLLDPDADTVIDRITLAFYDKACTQYGITFHTYESLKNPVVQYVQGDNKTATDFASAPSVTANTETLKGFMAYNYNPSDFTFNVTYEERNNCAGTMPEISDYTHKAALPVLSYGQTYSYRVGGENADGDMVYSPIYTFTTRPQNPTEISFVWMSDSQYTPYTVGLQNRMRTVLQAALKLCPNPDMMLHGGDFSDAGNYLWTYAAQVTGNEDFFTKYPLMSASGNHDTTGTSEIYRLINVDLKGTGRNGSQSTTTGTYYSYDYGNAHFVALNISKDAKIDGTQLDWLKTDLEAASGAQWKFVYFHRPMYTCAGEKEPDPMDDDLCASLEETLNKYKVDVVVQAHVHMYSRTNPITSLGKEATGWTTQTDAAGYTYTVNPGAPIYTVTATAASETEHIYRGASAEDTQPKYLAKYASGKANSFAIYHINGNKLSVDACYVDDNGGNLQYYDKFGIIKSAA